MTDEGNDTPSVDELYQGEDEFVVANVPVEVKNPVRTDRLPTTFGMMDTILIPAASDAVQILGRDPRRAELTLWCTGSDLVIAADQGSAQARMGATLSSGLAVPVHFGSQSELWVRPATTAVDAVSLSVVTELWSR